MSRASGSKCGYFCTDKGERVLYFEDLREKPIGDNVIVVICVSPREVEDEKIYVADTIVGAPGIEFVVWCPEDPLNPLWSFQQETRIFRLGEGIDRAYVFWFNPENLVFPVGISCKTLDKGWGFSAIIRLIHKLSIEEPIGVEKIYSRGVLRRDHLEGLLRRSFSDMISRLITSRGFKSPKEVVNHIRKNRDNIIDELYSELLSKEELFYLFGIRIENLNYVEKCPQD